MEMEKEREIARILAKWNPFWESGKLDDVPQYKRLDFDALVKRLPEREICAIIGARQVGKTTLMRQLIAFLLSGNAAPRSILYLTMDEQSLRAISDAPINDAMDVYQKTVLKEEIQKSRGKVFIFLDEIQKVPNWSGQLKNWHDLTPNVKFIVSGSSSTQLFRESVESLVGRFRPQKVMPMKFKEAFRFREFLAGNPEFHGIHRLGMALRGGFGAAIERKDGKILFDSISKNLSELTIIENKAKAFLEDYLLKGGYPKIVQTGELEKCAETLKINIENVVNRDLANTYDIKHPLTLYKLLRVVAYNTSDRLSIDKLAGTLRGDRGTIERYLSHLEESFLISSSEYFAGSEISKLKFSKKFYVCDMGIRNVVTNMLDRELMQNDIGRIAESVAYNHLLRLLFSLSNGMQSKLFYWKDKQKNEVDVIFNLKNTPIPVEVKYRNKIEDSMIKGIYRFMEEKKAPFGVVITRDYLEFRGNIVFIPLWVFVLMV